MSIAVSPRALSTIMASAMAHADSSLLHHHQKRGLSKGSCADRDPAEALNQLPSALCRQVLPGDLLASYPTDACNVRHLQARACTSDSQEGSLC